ncbi:MAG TPA: homoserine kinase [Gammaproteobacteria bacterium]|nr:homoserine kinase [Gammaproteobacteria bacterium]
MNTINADIKSASAFAPATCANVAVGFDILGFALENIGDTVTLTRRDDDKIIIDSIETQETLPLETHKNTASFVIQKICEDLKIKSGFGLKIKKNIPLSSGMGGSAASAVAALVAFNKFLTTPLSTHQLLHYALLGEALVSGQPHADNIAPCIFGGLTLITSRDPIEIIQLPIPDIYCVLVHPHLHVSTKQARKILTPTILLNDHVMQSANLAGFISALYENNLTLLQKSLSDILIEPQRAQFVPGFYKIKEAALKAGALGMSFSGSGPSLFAFAKNKVDAEKIGKAMQDQLKQTHILSDYWISRISKEAAHALP